MHQHVAECRNKTDDQLWELTVSGLGTPAAIAAKNELERRERTIRLEALEATNKAQRENYELQKQIAESQLATTKYTGDAALAQKATAIYTKDNAFWMRWSVIVIAAASLVNAILTVLK